MSVQEREGLIARIRQMRRTTAAPAKSSKPAAGAVGAGASEAGASEAGASEAGASEESAVRALEQRVAHLEQLLEGLQDSVHRESERQAALIAELQAQTHPAAMSAALAKDARDRGL